MNRLTKSYIGALLCLGAAAGVVSQAAMIEFLDLGGVGTSDLVSTGVVSVGLVGLGLLLVYDYEQQQYSRER